MYLVLTVVFLLTQTVLLSPDQSRAENNPSVFAPVKTGPSSARSPESLLSRLPQELGIVRNMQGFEAVPSDLRDHGLPFLVHIQDAHANPSVQSNMLKILEYLAEGGGKLYVGVEGAGGPLHPEYFDIFPAHPEAGDAIVQDLHEKGELSGVESFAWNRYREKTGDGAGEKGETAKFSGAVFGVESPDLYREDLQTFRTLLAAGASIQSALERMRNAFGAEKSRIMNGELRDFLKERDRRRSGRFGSGNKKSDGNLAVYLEYLGRQASEVLAIDLGNPVEQLRFPNLYRISRLKIEEKSFNREAAASEWQQIFKLLRSKAKSFPDQGWVQTLDYFARSRGVLSAKQAQAAAELWSNSPPADAKTDLYPRKLFERTYLFAKKNNIDLSAFPAFCSSFRFMILESEIEAEELAREMDGLESYLIEKLAKSPEDQKFVRQLENFDLLEKLLRLELTLPEFRKVRSRGAELREQVRAYKEPIQKNVSLEMAYDTALHFYDVARKRDRVLIENAMESMKQLEGPNGEKKGAPALLVLVTGGFHADGIEEFSKSAGMPYAAVLPRVGDFDRGERYGKVMTGENADLTGYFKSANPFATKQEALLFKEMLEVGVPTLIKGNKISPSEIPELVRNALKTHPVFSRAVSSDVFGGGEMSFVRVMPVRSGGENGLKNAALMQELSSASVDFRRSLAGPPKNLSAVTGIDLEWDSKGMLHSKVVPAAEKIRVGDLEVVSGPISPEVSAGAGAPVVNAAVQPGTMAPPAAAVPQTQGLSASDVWSFFPEGMMDPRLEARLLEAIPKVGALDGGSVFVQGLGAAVLPFVNGAKDFSPENQEAVAVLNTFRLKIGPYRNILDRIIREDPEKFSLLGDFLSAAEQSDLASIGIAGPLSTEGYRAYLSGELPSEGFAVRDPKFPEDLQQLKIDTAERFGIGFSSKDIAGVMSPKVKVLGWDEPRTVSAEIAAKLWMAAALVRATASEASRAGISNVVLEALLRDFLGEKLPVSFGEKQFLHVQLPVLTEAQRDQLIGDFIPVFAALAATNLSMKINFRGNRDDAGKWELRMKEAATRGGVTLPAGQLEVVPSEGKQNFPSLPAKPLGGQIMLGPENLVAKVVLRKDISARYGFSPAEKDPKKLAAHILVVVKNLLKKQLGDRYAIINPEKSFPEEFGLAVNLLEKYLAEVAIQTSA